VQACFEAWIVDAGTDAVLDAVLRQIPFSPAIGAFHGLIRLGYGLDSHHAGEVAAGLAALTIGKLDIDVNRDRPVAAGVEQALAGLAADLAGCEFEGLPIVGKLRGVAADPRFAAAMPVLAPSQAMFEEMALVAILAYWQTKDFTVLHMVTAAHAARLLFARLPDALVQRMLPQLWAAVCAAYVSVGAPPLDALADVDAQLRASLPASAPAHEDWDAIFQAACASDNDHVIKMSYTCQQENLHRPSPLYYAAARRLVA
jgi:hypothetical protein